LHSNTLAGARILVVEDEALVSILIEDALTGMGCVPVGPASSLAEAIVLAESEMLAGAILDVNVDGKPVYPVADALKRRGIPYVFVTGYQRDDLPPSHRDASILEKPFEVSMLTGAMRSMIRLEAC